MICQRILTPVVRTVRFLLRLVREVVRTVCDWVTSTITIAKEVCNEVCGWLGPFSFLCDWVCKIIEVVETAVDWVCREVIDRIFSWVEVIFEYIVYILRWVCWAVDWLIRWIPYLLCRAGMGGRRTMRVCVKVLTEADGTPAIRRADIDAMMRDAATILANCDIDLVEVDRDLIARPDFLDTTTCNFGATFSAFWVWMNRNACEQNCTVTVYFVRDIIGAAGCAFPGTNWVTVDAGGDGGTVVQEIGHIAGLWGHTADPNNVMTDQAGGTGDQITRAQCCMIRTSPFTCVSLPRTFDIVGRAIAPLETDDEPRSLKDGPPEAKGRHPHSQ